GRAGGADMGETRKAGSHLTVISDGEWPMYCGNRLDDLVERPLPGMDDIVDAKPRPFHVKRTDRRLGAVADIDEFFLAFPDQQRIVKPERRALARRPDEGGKQLSGDAGRRIRAP